jgi:drug/metabolite transporter (DMT)-like permease
VKPRHWFVFVLLGAIWSSSFLWIKIGLQETSPTLLVAFRMLFGALAGVALALQRGVAWPRDIRTWKAFVILGPTSLAIPIFLISWGEQSIDSAVASVLNASVPLFTLIVAHFSLSDDRMTMAKTVGLLTGFAGVAALVSEGLMSASRASVAGQAAVILASIFYAGSAVYARKVTQHVVGWVRGIGPLITASAAMWLLVPVVENPVRMPVLPITWLAILWLGVLGSGIAMCMFYYLIHEIGPTRTSVVTYLFPVGGVTLGVVFLGERLTWQLVVGTTLILSGILLVNRTPRAAAAPVSSERTDRELPTAGSHAPEPAAVAAENRNQTKGEPYGIRYQES